VAAAAQWRRRWSHQQS